MKSMRANVVTFIYTVLAALFLFVLGSILFHNRSLGTWCAAGILAGAFLFLTYKGSGKDEFFDEIYNYCLIAFLIVIGIFQISKIEELRFVPSFDLDAIYGGAIQWAETGTFSNYYDYFDWFPNNLGGLCFFYVLFKIGRLFSKDYFFIAACGNEILLLLTFTMISLIAKKMWGSRYGLLTLLMTGCMLPFLFMTDAFYTDSLSALFPVLLLYLSMKIEDDGKRNTWKLYLLSGIAAAAGIFIKPTVFIMVIAIVLSFLMRKKWGRAVKYIISVGMIYLLFALMFQTYMYHEHLDPELAEIKNTPSYHWVMMGLKGEGGYNPEDYEFTRSFQDPEKREEALKAEIESRISQKGIGGMAALYGAKLFRCFGDGTFGISDFLDDNPQNQSLLHSYILYGGSKYGVYHSLCNIVFYSLLMLMFLYLIINGKKAEGAGLAPSMALGGLAVFLMHWETSPRYITNYVPVIILLAAGGTRYLVEKIVEKNVDKKLSDITNRYSCEIRIFGKAICFRMVIYIFSVCIMAIMGDYTGGITFSDFLEAWKRWDSAHYINIAENGYAGAIENGEHIFLVFYPLYPWLMKTLSIIIDDFRLCGIMISVVCYGVGSIFFYKITEKEFDSKTAENALIMISIFPFAFFFGSIATESLFFAVASAFFYYLRKHDWNMTAFWGFLACLTKVQGVLLAFAVLVELFYFKRGIRLIREKKWKSFLKRVIYPGCVVATMLFGLVVYLLINYAVEGDLFRFMYYQKNHWGNGLCPIWETIKYITQNAVSGWSSSVGMSLWVPELLLFAGYLIAIVYGSIRKLRPMYLAYLVVFFLLTYSSTWLISAGRYTLSALPVFMLAGDWLSKHEKRKIPVMILSAMLMVIYMTGYYSWKQIM